METEQFLGSSGHRVMLHLVLTEKHAKDIRDFSLFPKESEILLPPNMLFKVEGIFSAGNDLSIVQCRQMKTVDAILG